MKTIALIACLLTFLVAVSCSTAVDHSNVSGAPTVKPGSTTPDPAPVATSTNL